MHTFPAILEELIDEHPTLTFKEVYTKLGVSKSFFYQILSGKKSPSFRNLLKLSYILTPENPTKTIFEWCHLEISTECTKNAFEYASVTRNIPLLKYLVTKHKKSPETLGECSKVYAIQLDYIVDKISGKEFYYKIENIRDITDKSLLVLIEIFKNYGLYHLGKFFIMAENISLLEKKISSVGTRETFLKECFTLRLCEIFSPVFLHMNYLEQCKFYANVLINSKICAKLKSDGYYCMGMALLLENKKEAIHNLKKSISALDSSETRLVAMAENNLAFAEAFLKVEETTTRNDYDLSTNIFKKIKYEEVVNEEEVAYLEKEKSKDTFCKYYFSLLKKSVDGLAECFMDFLQAGDVFFASAMIHEISRTGAAVGLFKNLINLKIGDVSIEKENYQCFSDFDVYSTVV